MGEVQQKLGYALKLERERRNLSLEDMSQQLKISETNLQAIEDGNPSALPGEMYFRMFAKSYAEALGIDYERTIEAIREELGEPEEPVDSGAPRFKETKPTASASPSSIESTGGGGYVAPSSHRAAPARGSFRSWALQIGLGVVVVVMAIILFTPKGSRFGFFRIGNSETEERYTDTQDDTSAESDVGEYRVVAGSKEKTVLSLEMIARDRTWATVIADGDTALHYNLKPWREYVVNAQEKLIVSILSPLSVEMKLNGLAVDLSDPEKGTIRNVEVTPENMSLFIKRGGTDSAGLDTSSGYLSEPLPDSESVTPAGERRPTDSAAKAGATITPKAEMPAARPSSDSLSRPQGGGR